MRKENESSIFIEISSKNVPLGDILIGDADISDEQCKEPLHKGNNWAVDYVPFLQLLGSRGLVCWTSGVYKSAVIG